MTDERDEIRSRINIVDLVGSTVILKRAGKHYKGLCPFHQDRNPSFYVDPESGRYRCWSCGEAGDVFTWVMKTQNVDFVEALQELARQAGVVLKGKGSSGSASQRQSQRTAMEEALAFFQEALSKHTTAQDYCRNRGLDDEAQKTWELGYAPDVGGALANHLRKKGISLAESQELFLVDGDQQQGYKDKFWGRLMFPIRNERNELVAFGGRLLGDGHPKYINSGDTPLFRKSRVLYGMHRAKDHLQRERKAVLVEGYLDVIACHRAGVTNALASLGTSLTEEHAKLLKRWVDEVVILYDSDSAGQKAADRAIDVLRPEGLRVRLALMPEGEDPDTLLRNSGPRAVVKAVETGLSPQQFRIAALERRLQPTDEAFWSEAVEILAMSSGDLETEASLVRLAGMYPGTRDVTQATKVLKRLIGKVRKELQQGTEERRRVVAAGPRVLRGTMVTAEIVVFLSLCTTDHRMFAWGIATRQPHLLITGAAIDLAEAVKAAFPEEPPEGPIVSWLPKLCEEAQTSLSDLLMDFRSENLTEERLTDSYEWLQKKFAERELKQMARNSNDKQAILQRLKELKPDPNAKKPGDDDRLF